MPGGVAERHQRGLEQQGPEDRPTAHADKAHHGRIHPPLLDLQQHDAEQKDRTGDDGDHRDGAMKAAHHEEGLRGLRGDRVGVKRLVTERIALERGDGGVHRGARIKADAEAVHLIGRAEERGQVREVEPHVPLGLGDLGRIRARLEYLHGMLAR